MDSPYWSSCSRFGLGRIQEGGWERGSPVGCPEAGGCINGLRSVHSVFHEVKKGAWERFDSSYIWNNTCRVQIKPFWSISSIKCKPNPAHCPWSQDAGTQSQAMDWLDLMIRTKMDNPRFPPFQSCILELECPQHRAHRQWTLHSDNSQSQNTQSRRVSQSDPFCFRCLLALIQVKYSLYDMSPCEYKNRH